MPEMGLRERKKQDTRLRIARTAAGMFAERGFEQVSVAEIAEAAGVSKVTVFNYFPAKEDMFFALPVALFPDLAGAVRERGAGRTPLAALRAYVLAELDRRAEWTGLHDGVARWARVTGDSPALTDAFARRWQALQADLVAALSEAVPDPLAARLAAAQVGAVLHELVLANVALQAAGASADDCAAEARRGVELGFHQLAAGLQGP